MPGSFDAYEYAAYLRRRWRVIATACGVAAVMALAVSLVLPKRYTAVAKILIEPPAGNDPRVTVAVTPIYLESLKTYEYFASNERLFLEALNHFKLREQGSGRSVEAWKRRVLRVGIPRNTKILEISVTLPDPKMAQALALYLADETAKLSRTMSREGDRELAEDAEKYLEEARLQRERIDAEMGRLVTAEPIDSLVAELDSLDARRSRLEREQIDAEVRAADLANQEKSLVSGKGEPDELADVRKARGSAQARAEYVRAQLKALDQEAERKRSLLADRRVRRDKADTQRKSSVGAYESMLARVRDVRGAIGYRGERLRVIDPGIVPEAPSSPNVFLNVLAALLAAALGSIAYLSLTFGAGRHDVDRPSLTWRQTANVRDD